MMSYGNLIKRNISKFMIIYHHLSFKPSPYNHSTNIPYQKISIKISVLRIPFFTIFLFLAKND